MELIDICPRGHLFKYGYPAPQRLSMNFSSDIKVKNSESFDISTAESENSADHNKNWYSTKKGIFIVFAGVAVLLLLLVLLVSFGFFTSEAAQSRETSSHDSTTTQINTNTETKDNVVSMDKLIYFLRQRTDGDLFFNLYSVKPDGSEMKLRHERLGRKYVVSNDGKTVFYSNVPKYDTLFSVDLTKEPGESTPNEVLKLQNERIISMSINSDGSQVVLALSGSAFSKSIKKVQMVEFIEGKWGEPQDISSSFVNCFNLSPKFNEEWIFWNTLSDICKNYFSKERETESEGIIPGFNLFASDGDRYAIIKAGKLLIKTFGWREVSREVNIPLWNLTFHKWKGDDIYFSAQDSDSDKASLYHLNLIDKDEELTRISSDGVDIFVDG